MRSLKKNKHDKYCLPYIDLAVGARVMVTKNLATQIRIYNGATGIVVGFGFHTDYNVCCILYTIKVL